MFEKPTDSLPETQPLHLAVQESATHNLQHPAAVAMPAEDGGGSPTGSDSAVYPSPARLGRQDGLNTADHGSPLGDPTHPEPSSSMSPELCLGDYFGESSDPRQHSAAGEKKIPEAPIPVPVLEETNGNDGTLIAKGRLMQGVPGSQDGSDDDISTFGEYFAAASPAP